MYVGGLKDTLQTLNPTPKPLNSKPSGFLYGDRCSAVAESSWGTNVEVWSSILKAGHNQVRGNCLLRP